MNANDGSGRNKPRPGVDAKESARWRSSTQPGAAAAAKKPAAGRADPCAVIEEDLKVLDQIHALLRALNDAYAGGARVGQLVGNVPVLAARILRRARKRNPAKANCTLPEAMTLIGNIGLESELLQLLEDLTVLSSEVSAKNPTK
jgi:hypothetical protein